MWYGCFVIDQIIYKQMYPLYTMLIHMYIYPKVCFLGAKRTLQINLSVRPSVRQSQFVAVLISFCFIHKEEQVQENLGIRDHPVREGTE